MYMFTLKLFPKLSVSFFRFPSARSMASAGLLAVLLLLLCAAQTAANSWGQTEGLGDYTGDASGVCACVEEMQSLWVWCTDGAGALQAASTSSTAEGHAREQPHRSTPACEWPDRRMHLDASIVSFFSFFLRLFASLIPVVLRVYGRHYTHPGSGYQSLCYPPNPEYQGGMFSTVDNEGAIIYGQVSRVGVPLACGSCLLVLARATCH
jgi:hypothetical protein